MKIKKLAVALAAAGFASGAHATNGMNMEGYGPIASGMGGASFAYDNGTAAMMNNPATLGLANDHSRLDVAIGFLGPDVKTDAGGMPFGGKSGGDAYYMPAVGWAKKQGSLSYGVGMFAQGGMGTEYASGMDGLPERSELGVGRLIFPIAYNVTPDFSLGASLDFVWAMMDIRMAMPTSSFGNLMTSGTGAFNDPILTPALFGTYEMGRIDFSDSNDYTGKAKATGYAGKLGFTMKLSQALTLGGTYHSKTSLSDMKTSANGASMTMTDAQGVGIPLTPYGGQVTLPGKLVIHDFQWPETYGLGIALQATPSLMLAADVKHIGWKSVMKNFTMTYSTDGDGVLVGPSSATFQLPQNWKDQTVFSLGAAYKLTDAFTLRAGANLGSNPIPDVYMNYLFPAIVKDHYTLGFGYAFSPLSEVNFSLQYAPEVKATNPDADGDPSNGAQPYTTSHGQTNWQLMYSQKF
ncbi:MAG: outer membrane protein transport protein [Gallionellaceae bacterium]|nr:outer membrane protein transport protein [Gallionellaceae bacterium]